MTRVFATPQRCSLILADNERCAQQANDLKVFTSDRCEETKGAGEMRTMQQVQVCLDLALGFGKKCSGFWQVGKIRSGPRMPRNATWDCAFGHTHCRYTHSLSLSLRPNRGGLDCASQRSNSSLQLGHVRNTHHFERDCDWRLNAFRSQAGPEAARLTRNKPGDCCRSRAQSTGQPELQARSLRWKVEEWGGACPGTRAYRSPTWPRSSTAATGENAPPASLSSAMLPPPRTGAAAPS